MGTTSRHFPCIIPKITAQRQILFHHEAKKRGIGKKMMLTVRTVMLQEHVDVVAGDVNGASWGRPSSSDRHQFRIVEEAFENTNLPMASGPSPLW